MLDYLKSVTVGLCLTFALAPLAYISAKPNREIPKKELPPPNIAGPSVYGFIAQEGRRVAIDGNATWFVEDGEIRKDGKLFVIWIFRSDGRRAPGLYDIHEDGSIKGFWAFGTNVTIGDDGEMIGLNSAETLRYKVVVEDLR